LRVKICLHDPQQCKWLPEKAFNLFTDFIALHKLLYLDKVLVKLVRDKYKLYAHSCLCKTKLYSWYLEIERKLSPVNLGQICSFIREMNKLITLHSKSKIYWPFLCSLSIQHKKLPTYLIFVYIFFLFNHHELADRN
jgi:hypothetical protein